MARIVSSPLEFNVDDLYVDLRAVVGHELYLKCEGFNFAGSVKVKAAVEMVESMECDGGLLPGDTLVESSSGNMGVALSIVAAHKGYRFVCVTDVRSTDTARRMMTALGADVRVVTEPDAYGGYLGGRLDLVRRLCAANPDFVWLNQYVNSANWAAHFRSTGPQIGRAFPDVDVVFFGAGTTGTLMGCARYFREFRPEVTVVAVDSVGSATFGHPGRPRLIPGLGTSVRPAIVDQSYIDDVVHVSEVDTVAMCHELARAGYLFGGSTGTVVRGATTWLAANRPGAPVVAVALAPDLGGGYVDSVYDPDWCAETFGLDVLSPMRNAAT